jgi:hypothetical protein
VKWNGRATLICPLGLFSEMRIGYYRWWRKVRAECLGGGEMIYIQCVSIVSTSSGFSFSMKEELWRTVIIELGCEG